MGDFAQLCESSTLAAEEGLDLAQYNLAILYFTANGVGAGITTKHLCGLKKRQSQATQMASSILGLCITTGSSTALDFEEASSLVHLIGAKPIMR